MNQVVTDDPQANTFGGRPRCCYFVARWIAKGHYDFAITLASTRLKSHPQCDELIFLLRIAAQLHYGASTNDWQQDLVFRIRFWDKIGIARIAGNFREEDNYQTANYCNSLISAIDDELRLRQTKKLQMSL